MQSHWNDDSEMSVLVTGGAGYIGSHIVLALMDAGFRPIVLDDFSTGSRSTVPEAVPCYQGDVGDRVFVQNILTKHRVEAVVHMAASILPNESIENPLKYYTNNTAKSGSLLEIAGIQGVRHIVFSSTASVYSVTETLQPLAEDAPLNPLSPYGRSKLMVEQLLPFLARSYGFNGCVLRYFNVAGADPDMRAGPMARHGTHLVKVACEAAVGARSHIAVYGTDYPTSDGTCIRDYVHVADLADAHVSALRKLIEAPSESWTLNCGYGRGYSVLEVLDAFDAVVGRAVDRRVTDRRPGDSPYLVSDNRRITQVLDWTPRHSDLKTILTHALAWEQLRLSREKDLQPGRH